MADINNRTLYTSTTPRINYLITYKSARPSNTQMTYDFTITCSVGKDSFNSTGHYFGKGYAIFGYITVNGTKKGVRLKASSDIWQGSTKWKKTLSVTCTSKSTANLGVLFQTVADGITDTDKCGILKNDSYTVAALPLLYTNTTAPTVFTASPNPFQNSISLSWDGAKGGTSNSISAYEIQYRQGPIGGAMSGWAAEIVHSSTVAKNAITRTISDTKVPQGNQIQFQIRTRGSAGANHYSGWKASNYIIKNTTPVKPTSLAVSQSSYNQGETLTLSWNGASDQDNNIDHYVLEWCLYSSGNWGAWQALQTVTTSATSGAITHIPQIPKDQEELRYRIKAVDALGISSGWTESSAVKRDDHTGVFIPAGTTWKKGYPYVCVDGVWKKAVVYCGANGEWKKGKD